MENKKRAVERQAVTATVAEKRAAADYAAGIAARTAADIAALRQQLLKAKTWGAKLALWKQLLPVLREAYGPAPTWRSQAAVMLVGYCEEAAGGARSWRLAAYVQRQQGERHQFQPLLMMVSELAAGELWERVELDANPRLEVAAPTLSLLLMKIKLSPNRVGKAKQQLLVAARMFVWLLLHANPQLAAGNEVQVVGTICVPGRLTPRERQRCQNQLRVPLKVDFPGLPPSMRVVLRLHLKVM